jgi:hypothetical protein
MKQPPDIEASCDILTADRGWSSKLGCSAGWLVSNNNKKGISRNVTQGLGFGDNIRMDVRETGREFLDWIHLGCTEDRCWPL